MNLERNGPHRLHSRAALRYLQEEAGERIECYFAKGVRWRVAETGEHPCWSLADVEAVFVPELSNLQTVVLVGSVEATFHTVWSPEHPRTLVEQVRDAARLALRRELCAYMSKGETIEVEGGGRDDDGS